MRQIKKLNSTLDELMKARNSTNMLYNNEYYRELPNTFKGFLKKAVRRIIRPIVKPIIDQQNAYNASVVHSLDLIINCLQMDEIAQNMGNESCCKPRVVQLVPDLHYGDAVGNEVCAIGDLLYRMGYKSEIYTVCCDNKLMDKRKHYSEMIGLKNYDVVIYHFAIGCSELAKIIKNIGCRKIMIYHNITPAKFFKEYSNDLVGMVEAGRKELAELAPYFDYCLADSEYNAQEIRDLGVTYPVDVLPLLIPFDDYDKGMNVAISKKYGNDGWTNILFVGRIVPNKKQEDIIAAFAYYKKNINPQSRLFLVGNYNGMEKYYQKLLDYVKKLQVEDVIFTGHIGFDEILAYYNLADVFVCMSEHEGFGVPLVEAMYFDIPVIAYCSCAVPWVMGNSGVVVDSKEPKFIAETIDRVVSDKGYRDGIIAGQQKRIVDLSYRKTSAMFVGYLDIFLEKVV